MDHYLTINKSATADFKERGSKFIAHAFQIDDAVSFKSKLQLLKREHSKAVHHCFAYRLGISGDNFRLSDDGEPSGTAGKQILGQIDSRQLTHTAIIVVRYFGGTLLGVTGLINAYRTSAALVLQTIPIVQKQIELLFTLHFNYTRLNEVMRIIKQYNCTILGQDMQLFSLIKLGVPKSRLEEVKFKFNEMPDVELKNIL